MDNIKLSIINQTQLARDFHDNKKQYKLMKNRAEKARAKAKKVVGWDTR